METTLDHVRPGKSPLQTFLSDEQRHEMVSLGLGRRPHIKYRRSGCRRNGGLKTQRMRGKKTRDEARRDDEKAEKEKGSKVEKEE